LYRGRGVLDLLKASRLLWKKDLNFKLLIYGFPIDQFTRKNLLREINKNGSDRIIIKEKVGDIGIIVRKATVVVLPFRYPCSFQTPFTLLEPMGWGVPVITTNAGSHGEWVHDQETGLICEKENINDIAEKIETVFKDKKLVERITTGAYSLLKKRYQEKDVLLETLKRYEE
ncbi:glycosyltransferase family 4 protein, partial [Candidatus Gottesmanbacteria bacterium]|nr:glycosyltransferase family 4 protein [Candidatus Gottesmanbacteria bacterium]